MAGTLLVEDAGTVAVLTLSNPDKRNALDPPLCETMVAELAALPGRGVRAAVVRGDPDGRAFSAGFDLVALGSVEPDAGERVFESLLDAVAACPVPLVAALGGPAIGGGCELAAACDLRVAHAGVKLGLPPARLGIAYTPRGLARFSALCGEARARQLLLWARTIEAGEAHAWGLVDVLVPEAEVAAAPPPSPARSPSWRRSPYRGCGSPSRRSCAAGPPSRGRTPSRSRVAAPPACRSADAAEALAALAARRKPASKGE